MTTTPTADADDDVAADVVAANEARLGRGLAVIGSFSG